VKFELNLHSLSAAGDGSSDLSFYAGFRTLPGGRKSQVSFGNAS
jgi:hypothetical protein